MIDIRHVFHIHANSDSPNAFDMHTSCNHGFVVYDAYVTHIRFPLATCLPFDMDRPTRDPRPTCFT